MNERNSVEAEIANRLSIPYNEVTEWPRGQVKYYRHLFKSVGGEDL